MFSVEQMLFFTLSEHKADRAQRIIPSPSEYGTGMRLNIPSAAFAQKNSTFIPSAVRRDKAVRKIQIARFDAGPQAYISRLEHISPAPTLGVYPTGEKHNSDTRLLSSLAHRIWDISCSAADIMTETATVVGVEIIYSKTIKKYRDSRAVLLNSTDGSFIFIHQNKAQTDSISDFEFRCLQ